MSQYEQLDALILAAIDRFKSPLYDPKVNTEAERIALATGREAFRIIDGRIQALRKRNEIVWFTKAQARGGLGGWHRVWKKEPTK